MATITGHTTRSAGTILTAAIYNADHVNHINNATALNNAKLEGAAGPVTDGHAVVFNGTSGASLRTLAAFPVAATRAVNTSGGLSGGGDLSADRTLSIATNGVTADKLANGNLAVGFTASVVDDGTKSSGTYTPNTTGGNFRKITNGGAHTIAAPANDGTIIIKVTNNASAGAITFSGFAKVDQSSVLTTTNGHIFFLYITRVDATSHVSVRALQ